MRTDGALCISFRSLIGEASKRSKFDVLRYAHRGAYLIRRIWEYSWYADEVFLFCLCTRIHLRELRGSIACPAKGSKLRAGHATTSESWTLTAKNG